MKAVILGGGRRWPAATGAAVVVLLTVTLFMGGCGGNDDSSGSQIDDQAGDTAGNDQAGTAVSDANGAGGNVLPGYTESQCMAEMTARYGNADTARRVCEAVRADYGGSPQPQQLANVLPAVETKLGATPVPGAPASSGGSQDGGTPGGGGTSDGSGNGSGGGSEGSPWDSGGIEITVPPAP